MLPLNIVGDLNSVSRMDGYWRIIFYYTCIHKLSCGVSSYLRAHVMHTAEVHFCCLRF